MRFNNLQSALEKYRDIVIKEAKKELVTLKKANTGGLVDKIKKGNVKVYPNSL